MCVVNVLELLTFCFASSNGMPLLRELAEALDEHERRMTFVRVPCGWIVAECSQDSHAADAEDPFLAESKCGPACVELAQELSVVCVILLEVGVEKDDRCSSGDAVVMRDVHVATESLDVARNGSPLGALIGVIGVFSRIEVDVGIFLPAVDPDALVEVACAIEDADSDERDAEVGGCLAVVAGEDAQAAAIDRDGAVKAELGAEVGDRFVAEVGVGFGEPRVVERRFGLEPCA